MVKLMTTVKHKKKNIKKYSNKNKRNKNKKTIKQKKHYKRKKYSRKMIGGAVCLPNGECLKLVGSVKGTGNIPQDVAMGVISQSPISDNDIEVTKTLQEDITPIISDQTNTNIIETNKGELPLSNNTNEEGELIQRDNSTNDGENIVSSEVPAIPPATFGESILPPVPLQINQENKEFSFSSELLPTEQQNNNTFTEEIINSSNKVGSKDDIEIGRNTINNNSPPLLRSLSEGDINRGIEGNTNTIQKDNWVDESPQEQQKEGNIVTNNNTVDVDENGNTFVENDNSASDITPKPSEESEEVNENDNRFDFKTEYNNETDRYNNFDFSNHGGKTSRRRSRKMKTKKGKKRTRKMKKNKKTKKTSK